MSTPYGLEPVEVTNFMGTFDRGRDDVVPANHFIDSLNVKFRPKTVMTREGSLNSVIIGLTPGRKVVRHYFKRAEGYGVVCLYLLDDGKLYGIRNGSTSLLLNIPAMVDFSIYSSNNRIYISPHTGLTGLEGEKVYYWDGTNVRAAAGARPTAASRMTVTTSGTGTNEVQTLTLANHTGGNFRLLIVSLLEFTVALPHNASAAQIESALRGDNERQAITIANASGGTWTGEFAGQTTAGIAWNANLATVVAAFEALSTIGTGNISGISGDGTVGSPWILLFQGSLAKQEQQAIIVNGDSLTGSTPTIAQETVLVGRKLLGVGNVTVSGTNPFTITFVGDEAAIDQPMLDYENNLTGTTPTITIVETTAGVPAGKIDAGKRFWAVVYETESGFVTGPGPLIASVFSPTGYDGPGAHKADLAVVPLGPAGTSKRHILVTRAGLTEYFFVPDGNIDDNTTTTIANLDFYDSDLVESADYLFDILAEIPACLKLVEYAGRMVALGFPQPDGSLARISRANSIETFDEVEGLHYVNPNDQHVLKNAWELHGLIYFAKNQGVYFNRDTGEEPSFWPKSESIDKGVGTYVNGISEIPNFIAGVTKDRLLVVDASGLLLFNGSFVRPELTWKIHDIWKRVNLNYAHKIQIYDDPVNQFLYMNVPFNDDTEPSAVLFADYSECGAVPDAFKIKWTVWRFPEHPISISVFDLNGKGNPIFRYGLLAGADGVGLIRLCAASDSKSDRGAAIDNYIKTWLMAPRSSDTGQLNFFGFLRLRIEGSGNLDVTYYGLDDVVTSIPPIVVIAGAPGKEYDRLTNFINERLSIKIRMDGINEWFNLFRLVPHAKFYGVRRPA